MSGTQATSGETFSESLRLRFLNRETAELYLLLDFLSGRADRSLRPTPDEQARSLLQEQQVRSAGASEGDLPEDAKKKWAEIEADLRDPTRLLLRTMKIRYPLAEAEIHFPEDAAFLLRARDVLNTRAWPATGATIAFTAMVFEMRQQLGQWFGRPVPSQQSRPRLEPTSHPSESAADLAERAYPALKWDAYVLARSIRRILWCMWPVLLLALALSAYTAWGKVVLDTLDAVRRDDGATEQALASVEASSLPSPVGNVSTAGASPPNDGSAPDRAAKPDSAPIVHFCDRPRLKERLKDAASDPGKAAPDPNRIVQYDSPAQIHICDRVEEITQRRTAAYSLLAAWEYPLRRHPPSQDQVADIKGEQRATAILAVVGNYGLPIIYGILGSSAFVLRRFYDRLSASLLAPRDRRANAIRIALGTLIGACIGLFYSGSTAAQTTGILGAAVTLSTSAIAFLAGYGVEGVFTALDSLISQVFRINGTDKPQQAAQTGS